MESNLNRRVALLVATPTFLALSVKERRLFIDAVDAVPLMGALSLPYQLIIKRAEQDIKEGRAEPSDLSIDFKRHFGRDFQ